MSAFGVLHLFFLHFPIALVLLAAWFEFRARKENPDEPAATTAPILQIAAVITVLAVGTGWLRAEAFSPETAGLDRHRWLGVAAGVLTVAAALLYRTNPREDRLAGARVSLILATGLVLAAGHFGAELTHGRDLYTRALDQLFGGSDGVDEAARRQAWAENALADWSAPEGTIGYASVQPILVGRCLQCHGPERVRGNLRLDTKRRAILGGDSGTVLIPGDRERSSLWFRCANETDDAPRMPKDDEPLSDAMLEALGRWIDSGADWPEPEPTPWRD